MSIINLYTSSIDRVNKHEFLSRRLTVDVLRLDLIHTLVSGNKWFKLQEYLAEARQLGKKTIVTFGGAYSNHILATAAACKETGFSSTGIIRGEEPAILSPTLKQAKELGMRLYFLSRSDYKDRKLPPQILSDNFYLIDEGGYGLKGCAGAAKILSPADESYTHICIAVGTGTTLAGLVTASQPNQKCIGIPVLKNHNTLAHEINSLLPPSKKNCFTLFDQFHFGGYAKYTPELIRFINTWYTQTGIPSDFVYTGKLFYGIQELALQDFFPPGSKLLIIHSGGLQGNRSLQKGTLIFGSNG